MTSDVTSTNAGSMEVDRLGEVDELAAEAEDLSSRGSDGMEDKSSQSNGGRAREVQLSSLPVAAQDGAQVAAAVNSGTVLEAPATQELCLTPLDPCS